MSHRGAKTSVTASHKGSILDISESQQQPTILEEQDSQAEEETTCMYKGFLIVVCKVFCGIGNKLFKFDNLVHISTYLKIDFFDCSLIDSFQEIRIQQI